MAHEITASDGAMFTKEKAWHGLGYVVENAPSPTEALKISGLDWTVTKSAGIFATLPCNDGTSDEGYKSYSDNFCAVVRNDNNTILSVQSPEYQVVQNHEVFDLAYSLGDNVKVESALSLQGGKKIICLIQGDTFAPSNSTNDSITQYLALLSSHDGTLALSGLPTSVRIVCANTLRMALNTNKKNMIRFTHTGNIEHKKEAMSTALKMFAKTGKMFEETVATLSSTEWTQANIREFYLKVYEQLFSLNPIQANPKTEDEFKVYTDATTKIARWSETFDEERTNLSAPASAWMAVNSVTNYLQHNVSTKGRKVGWQNRAYNNLLGSAQDESVRVAKLAMAMI
jgi:phage/plasmid-like protein (TIGR03299 family)